MASRRYSIATAEAVIPQLQSFMMFDGLVSNEEGAAPDVLYSYMADQSQLHEKENMAGIYITFMRFSLKFNASEPTNYIVTDTREIAILELTDNVWMAVSRGLEFSTNENLLLSILKCCKNLYELFFPPPIRDLKTQRVTSESISTLVAAFDMILRSITWKSLAFVHLFDSFFQMEMPLTLDEALSPLLSTLLSPDSPVAHIAIMHGSHFLYYTFPTDVARTLSIALKVKLLYLFPKILPKQEERLYWIIGLSKSPSGLMNIYAPPINISGNWMPLVALRSKKLKVLLCLKPHVLPVPELLRRIPPHIQPIRRLFERLEIQKRRGKVNKPYVVIKNNTSSRSLEISHEKISDMSIPVVEDCIIRCHSFSRIVGANAEIGVPSPLDFFVYFRAEVKRETVVMTKPASPSISSAVSEANALEKSENVLTNVPYFK